MMIADVGNQSVQAGLKRALAQAIQVQAQLSGAGLESLSFTAVEYSGSDGMVCAKFWKNYFCSESCAIMPPTRGFGFKNRNFGGIFPRPRGPQNHFLTAVAKVAA
jgi:hypothetical protein